MASNVSVSSTLPDSGNYPLAVVIATYNRADALITCLEHLERQTWTDFEVVIVDDGSTDSTPQVLQDYERRSSLKMRFLRQENSGPACARNAAISVVRAPITLMIGDDVFGAPELVERHLKLHQQRPESQVAGLGLTLWDTQKQKVTSFMRFLDQGVQFAYPDLLAGKEPNWTHFYTSNLSLKTAVLRGHPFDENFPSAALEDIELGFRLTKTEGLEVVFMPEALAHHFHPQTFIQYCRRMRTAGWAMHLLKERWPEIHADPEGRNFASKMFRRLMSAPSLLLVTTQITAGLSRVWSPRRILHAVLNLHFCLGYKDREIHNLRGKNQQ
jgi:glycosyltransferase involved in cell wall biosynthesis